MIYAYIRVSTELQTNENQEIAINEYLERQNKKVDKFYADKISGTVDYRKRQLGELLDVIQKDDILICTELSRLGRSMLMIFNIIQELVDKGVEVIAIKNNFFLKGENDISSKVLMFAFGLSAEIERQLISERTKQGLERARLNGKSIGHKKGFKCTNVKLTPFSNEIIELLNAGKSISFIAKKYGVKWITARDFIRDRLNYNLENIPSVNLYREKNKKRPIE